MMQSFYNGYSWPQREAIHHEQRRLESLGELGALSYIREKRPCDICADPQRNAWHAEDYSQPFLFTPPAVFTVCMICHQRLHKRFAAPHEWNVFLAHVRCGGYGREFTALYSQEQRREWVLRSQDGRAPVLREIRARSGNGAEWWEHLSMDPDSLVAAWARPRPLRPYPSVVAYRTALARVDPTDRELELLAFHANSPRRTTTMRQLSVEIFASSNPATASAFYGALAEKLCQKLAWRPDSRADGSPVWMSLMAEEWQPEGGEPQWTMIPALAEVCRKNAASFRVIHCLGEI